MDVSRVFGAHIRNMSLNLDEIALGKIGIDLPRYSESILKHIIEKAQNIFESEPTVIDVPRPCIVVGDLHGQILDLYRIFKTCGLPPMKNYLFLGDVIDRGNYSLESITFLYVLKIMYPKKIFIIRGNHEFYSSNMNRSFIDEITRIYKGSGMYDCFQFSFAHIPLAAKIGKHFCVHGGLDPHIKHIDDINSIKKPIMVPNLPIIEGIVWSDPYENESGYADSPRGMGYLFGKDAVDTFFRDNDVDLIIRGHMCVDGVAYCFDNRVVTVFSASKYDKEFSNRGAVLKIDEDGNCTTKYFSPMNDPPRKLLLKSVSFQSEKTLSFIPHPPSQPWKPSTANSPRRHRGDNICKAFI